MPLHALSTTPVEHCELCHSTHFTEVASKDRDGQPLRSVICENCGLVFSDPRPNSIQIDDFYREGYRMAYKQAWQPRLKHTYRAGKVAQGRLRHLMPLLAPGSSVLDFGSGGGELVFILRELGHEARGIEPNIGYAEYSRDVLGIPVQIGGFAEARVEPRSLDLVTLFHVAEHLEHPVHALKIVAGWLREGGQLLVEVPNVESRCIWPSSRFHQAHLYNFNPATLAQAGRRAGLKVTSTFTSEDGGNVICVFEKPELVEDATPAPLPGNAQRVLRILHSHTVLTHALTAHPYVRPLNKIRRQWHERHALSRFSDGKTLLRSISREIKHARQFPSHSSATRMHVSI
jgi:SAM-dependent methyltransferase